MLVAPEAGAAAVIADMLFNVIGWTILQLGAPEPEAKKSVTASYGEFTQSISEQQIINSNQGNPDINDLVDCPDDKRINVSPDLFPLIATRRPETYGPLTKSRT